MDDTPLIDQLPAAADDLVALATLSHADRTGDLGADWWRIVRESYEGTGGFMASVRAATTGTSQPGDYDGGRAEGRSRHTYLTPFTRESGDAFTRRADRSAYENHVAPVVDIYAGHMDRRPPKRAAPDDVVAWWKDLDGEGHAVDGWMSAQRLRAQLVGWRAVLVDRPLDPDPMRPTGETVARALEPEEVRDWQVGVDGALDWIRLASEWRERSPSGGADVEVTELSVWTRAEWARVRLETHNGVVSVVERVGGTHPCGRVPVAVLRWQESLKPRALYGLSQVQGVVPLVLRLFNTLSEYDHHLANANFATLCVQSDNANIFSELKLGTTNGIRYDSNATAPSFIAPPSDVAVQYALRAEQLVRAIYTAAKVQRPGGEAQAGDAASGVAMAYEFAQTDAALQGFARRCAAFELELVSLYDAWKGADGATRAATTVVYPTRFDARGIQDDLTAFFAVLDDKVRAQFPAAVWREARKRLAALVLPEATDDVRAEIDAGIAAMFTADTASVATAAVTDEVDAAIDSLPTDGSAIAAPGPREEPVARTPAPNPEPIAALRAHVIDNDHERLAAAMPDLLAMRSDARWSAMLDPRESPHEFVYRFLDADDVSGLAEILRAKPPRPGTYGRKGAGTLEALPPGVSSWTAHPRSLIFSGFFSVVAKSGSKAVALLRASIGKSDFVGNPDALVASLGLPPDRVAGYAMERETIGWGDVRYDRAVFGALRPGQSLEGLAADLTEILAPLKSIGPDDWTEDYYLPELEG